MSPVKALEPRIVASDVRRSAALYRERFSFTADLAWPDDKPEFALLSSCGGRLQITSMAGCGSPGGCTLWIDVDDALGVHDRIAKLLSVEWGPEVYWYGRREFAVRDPDGHLVIVSQETDEAPTCTD